MSPPPYRALNPKTAGPWLGALPHLREKLGGEPADWQVREVGDGNLNLVFIVEGPAGALVAKQALPYVRLVGESWPLPLERSWYEHGALTEQARHAPGLTPEILHFDRDMALIAMEYLSPHKIMRKGIIAGQVFPRFGADIARFLSHTLFHTSLLARGAAEHKALVARFAGNAALCKITEDLVFTDPYRLAELNRFTPGLEDLALAFRADAPLKRAVQARKWQFMCEAQALLHGDLHTGSIMLTEDDTKVIDPEFAFMGPMGFDVGAVIGNLFLGALAQAGHEAAPGARAEYRDWLLAQAVAVWDGFEQGFLSLWASQAAGDAYVAALFADPAGASALAQEKAAFMARLRADSIAFAGIKMIRRILGLAHVEDLESIPDLTRRAACERRALIMARDMVLGAAGFSGMAEPAAMARQG